MSYDILTFHFEMNWGGIGRKEKKKKKTVINVIDYIIKKEIYF